MDSAERVNLRLSVGKTAKSRARRKGTQSEIWKGRRGGLPGTRQVSRGGLGGGGAGAPEGEGRRQQQALPPGLMAARFARRNILRH